MKNCVDKNCFICGGNLGKGFEPEYLKCLSCGHAVLKHKLGNGHMLNETLVFGELQKKNILFEYQRSFLLKFANHTEKLLDVGSGSGGFLYRIKEDFQKIEGLEINPECVEFAKKYLNIRVVSRVADLDCGYSAITIWQTLEHLSRDFLQTEMPEILKKVSPGGKVIISVPNEDSLLYRILNRNYPAYDVQQHLQQFSPKSLNQYMKLQGFEAEKTFFMLPYSAFCWLQGLMNLFNRHHNYMYYRRKRGWNFNLPERKLKIMDILNFVLAGFLAPVSILGTVIDIIAKGRGATINVCYIKTRKPEDFVKT